MAAKDTPATRERLENIVVALADSQERTERLMSRYAARTTEQFRKTDEQFRKTDARMAELREEANKREKAADERIARLVSAIGELIRRDRRLPGVE